MKGPVAVKAYKLGAYEDSEGRVWKLSGDGWRTYRPGEGNVLVYRDSFDKFLEAQEEVGGSTPRHKPPRMEDERGMVDGVFEFYDVDYYAAVPLSNTASMEVVPQTTGNVEITLGDSTFTLSHLDRADLIRALLHDFHYSPEKDGPHDSH